MDLVSRCYNTSFYQHANSFSVRQKSRLLQLKLESIRYKISAETLGTKLYVQVNSPQMDTIMNVAALHLYLHHNFP